MTRAEEIATLKAEGDLLAAACHDLDPLGSYGIFEMNSRGLWQFQSYGANLDETSEPEDFQAAVHSARRAYLRGRYRALNERAAARQQFREAAGLGIARFTDDGSYSLDRITSATAAEPRAEEELRQERLARWRSAQDAEAARVREAVAKRKGR